jgi:hypothetical protein
MATRHRVSIVLVLIVTGGCPTHRSPAPPADVSPPARTLPAGEWFGVVKIHGGRFPFNLRIGPGAATVTSVVLGAIDLPARLKPGRGATQLDFTKSGGTWSRGSWRCQLRLAERRAAGPCAEGASALQGHRAEPGETDTDIKPAPQLERADAHHQEVRHGEVDQRPGHVHHG